MRVFLILLLMPLSVWASPFPGSSIFPSDKSGLFLSSKGFQLDSAKTAWTLAPPPKGIPALVSIYKAPVPINGQQPALTVRVDQLKRRQNLSYYVRHWMRDYTRFGFEVLTAKPIRVKKNPAFLLDIVSHETHNQLRQVLFMRNKTAVILTCRDQQSTFLKTVKDCNQIIETFRWE